MNKRLLVSGLIVLSFVLLLISVIFFIDRSRELRKLDPLELESMTAEEIIQNIYDRQEKGSIPFYYFIPLFGFFGIVVGVSVYYIFSSDLEKKEKVIEYDTGVIMNLLTPEERKVITKIVENEGKVQQIEITYMEGYTKVKAHRIVEGLLQKGVLTKEAMGKMRLIKLNPNLYKILKKKD